MTNIFEDIYNKKLMSPSDAASLIHDGQNLVLSMAVSQPPVIMKAIADRVRSKELTNLPVYYMHANQAAIDTLLIAELMDVVRPHPMFMSSHDRHLAEQGRELGQEWINYIPCTFHQVGKLLTEEIGADCFAVTVSPMDKSGFFSLGTNADYGATVALKCGTLIVEENSNMPRTFGETLVHVSDVDAIVKSDLPLMEVHHRAPSKKDKIIAQKIAKLIPDGATLQLGVGGVPSVVVECLFEHSDLGLHTEVFSSGIASLIKRGNMSGKKKTLHPRKHIYTLALADAETYEFMNDNPSICGYSVGYVNSPRIIAQNDNMISVNAAIEIDLSGQINSEYVKGNQWSGPGGQLDFIRGAYASNGGMSFIALHSTCDNDKISKIVPKLNGPVTDPRMDVHYIVTEYGVVNLKGLSIRERAKALISVAHPNFRDELRDHMKNIGFIM